MQSKDIKRHVRIQSGVYASSLRPTDIYDSLFTFSLNILFHEACSMLLSTVWNIFDVDVFVAARFYFIYILYGKTVCPSGLNDQ